MQARAGKSFGRVLERPEAWKDLQIGKKGEKVLIERRLASEKRDWWKQHRGGSVSCLRGELDAGLEW